MSRTLEVVKSLQLTEAALVGCSIAENDHPAWSPDADYAAAERCIVGHMIYEAIALGSNLGQPPATSPDYWQVVGPTNRWLAFDLSSTTRTTFDESAWYEIKPGQAVTSVVLRALRGVSAVQLRVTDPDYGEVVNETRTVSSLPSESSWWAWTFERTEPGTEALFDDLPAYPNATLRLDLTGISGAGVGVIAYGPKRALGKGVRWGLKMGIEDFSFKERSPQGDAYLNQGPAADTVSLNFLVDSVAALNTHAFLKGLRATPCLWICPQVGSLWGFYQRFSIEASNAKTSEGSIDLEGLI
jgi:hypothetical protein